ncbi:hypothetical protein [Arthrobacter sp. zg-Y238]|uniref:hypothetical protein n=1 Tax=Arthrobacter sp. zg-Y238 TaxID=2964614 RepID=UPI00351D3A57
MTEEPVPGKAAAEETAAAERSRETAAAAKGTGKVPAAGEHPSTDGSTHGTPDGGTTHGPTHGTRRRGNRRAVSPGTGGPAGLLPIIAKEDDPRAWGDSTEDSESWLREQRPPHWG